MTSSSTRGLFITFEGNDCSGKSTACKYLVQSLKDKGFDVYHTREPGGTVVAEEIRNLILNKREDENICAMTELLLFAAARAQHIEKVIKPKMEEGIIVVCDRFSDSTFAYQGFGRGYVKDVLALEKMVHQNFEPNYTLFLNATLEECIKRMAKRDEIANRLDDESIAFKARVYEGYHKRYQLHKHRMHLIDAMQNIDGVNKQIDAWINTKFIQSRKQRNEY